MRKLIYQPNYEQGLAVYGYEPGQIVEADDENAAAMIAGGCFTEETGSAKVFAAKLAKLEAAQAALEEVQIEPEKTPEEVQVLEQPEAETASKRNARK